MEIDINRQLISIGNKYDIYVEGQAQYTAAKKLFRFLSEINISRSDSEEPVITLKKESLFILDYSINYTNGNRYEVDTISYWRRYYQCIVGKDTYMIYGHAGRKYSVFKNDMQVAYWDQTAVTWFNGENIKIIADKDSDAELLIAFCILHDDYDQNGKESTININIGSPGWWSKKFDYDWAPK